MAFLREAVERQKVYLIQQLINKGVVDGTEEELYQKSISEIVHDYERYCLDIEKSSNNVLRFTRVMEPQKTEKPGLH
ncbi:Fur-regulated basic protein FbpA [Saliterribacillus persicus]|uniref:Fur-regulated basic protein A n=1 Tax=Saliterribacillus persicus TaxID=930114 RepID=A0A368Y9B4_9BACI|nr:Fur-regulated basic protein FbpA [Saliterribacillus persicus]RCW76792.1 Fur-regulated basic protein A [Saliterribacillus persicus]